MEGKLLVCGVQVQILFDPGSTHSFLSPIFAKKIDNPPRKLDFILTVTTRVGKQVICRTYYPNCSISLGQAILPANLMVLDMHDFDIILCMDYLEAYHPMMDCFAKTISFRLKRAQAELMIQGNRKKTQARLISTLKARILVQSGCEAYIAVITDDKHSQGVEDIPVVCEFPDVFTG